MTDPATAATTVVAGMTEDAYRAALAMIHAIAQQAMILPVETVDGVLAAMGRSHALGPIVDPTLYRDAMEGLQQQEQLVRAFSKFRCELVDIVRDAERRRGVGRPNPTVAGQEDERRAIGAAIMGKELGAIEALCNELKIHWIELRAFNVGERALTAAQLERVRAWMGRHP